MTKFVFQKNRVYGSNTFLDFSENTGVGDLLFVNTNDVDQFRFYRRRNDWDECYMVEFSSKSGEYKLYWGHNKEERSKIDATELLLPSYPAVKWKRLKFYPLLAHSLPQILKTIEKRMYSQDKGDGSPDSFSQTIEQGTKAL